MTSGDSPMGNGDGSRSRLEEPRRFADQAGDRVTALFDRDDEHLPSPVHTQTSLIPENGHLDGGLPLDAFDPVLFRRNAETAITKLQQYLADSSIRGLDLTNPELLLQAARELMTERRDSIAPFDQEKLGAILDLYIRTGIQVHSPGYMGRQFSGVVPLGGVMDFVSSVVNQPSSFYEAGQLPNVVEQLMAEELNQFIGWEPGRFAMVTTSGGSLANLTALLAARNDKFPRFWSEGVDGLDGGLRPAVAVSEDVHYSVSRAVGIVGIGADQVVRLPLNRNQQICMEMVRPALEAGERRGLKVFCLVASAGTTSVGAFDPIDGLADLAHERDIWLHVDGAHGGSLLVSDQHRHKLKGIEKADSLTWDAHKMLFVPAMCTLLFYKDKEKSYGAFRQKASYVFEESPNIYTKLDSAETNFECTKRPMIMSLWTLWAMYGKALFARKVEYLCDMTAAAYRILQREPDFETLHRPESNILCFRYRPAHVGEDAVHDFQVAIRDRIKLEGNFFISKVNVDGTAALRVVVMNHQITTDHVHMLLDEIRRTGSALLSERR